MEQKWQRQRLSSGLVLSSLFCWITLVTSQRCSAVAYCVFSLNHPAWYSVSPWIRPHLYLSWSDTGPQSTHGIPPQPPITLSAHRLMGGVILLPPKYKNTISPQFCLWWWSSPALQEQLMGSSVLGNDSLYIMPLCCSVLCGELCWPTVPRALSRG